jgi:hypothetical protein
MKLSTLLIVLVISALAFPAIAQQTAKEGWFEEYLEEKIRNPAVIEYIEEMKARYDQGLPIPALDAANLPFALEQKPAVSPTVKSGEREDNLGGGAEPHIAMNPANPDQIAVTYMLGGAALDYPIFYSSDGGGTWNQSAFSPAAELQVQFPGDFVLGGGDPIFAFDSDGTLYMTWIYAHGGGNGLAGTMFYAYSADGGNNWTVPAANDHVVFSGDILASDLLDRQWMDVDNTGGTYDGNLYMSCVYFGGAFGTGVAGELVLVKGPADNGFTTNAVAVPITGTESTQFGNVKVDDNGDVHLACMRFDGSTGSGEVVYTKSTDGAATWSTATTISAATTGLPNGGNHVAHSRDNSATSLAVEGDNVYIAWSDMANTDLRSYYAYSNDGGTTWSNPVEYGVDALSADYYHVMPNLAADSGRVSISWYAVDRATMLSDFYIVESPDAGPSLGAPAIISGGTTDFTGAAAGQDFYGDYNASVRKGCNTWSVWADGRSGTPMTYVAKVNTCNILSGVSEVSAVNGNLNVGFVYPNPVQNEAQLNYTLRSTEQLTIEILSIDGKMSKTVFEGRQAEGQHQLSIDMSDYATGNYVLRFVLESGEYATRMVVKS